MISKLTKALITNQNKWFTLADQAIVSGVNFMVGVLLARFLGVEDYGLFAMTWMVVLFIAGIHQAFMISPLYALGPKQENRNEWVSGFNMLQVLFSLATALVIFLMVIVGFMVKPEWFVDHLIWLLPITAAVYLFNDYLRRVHYFNHQALKVLAMDMIGYLLQPLLIGALFYADELSIVSALGSVLVAQTASAVYTLATSNFEFNRTNLSKLVVENFNYSKYLVGTSLLQWFSGNYFILASAAIIGPVAVGFIRIAQNVMGVLHVLFIAMENIVPIRASEELNMNGIQSMMKYIRNISIQAALPTLILISLIAIFRINLLELLYGADNLSSAPILLAFCGIYVLVFIGTQLRFVIRTVEKNQLVFWSYVITSIISVLSAEVMVENFDVMGAVIGLASMQLITLSIYIYYLRNQLKWIFK